MNKTKATCNGISMPCLILLRKWGDQMMIRKAAGIDKMDCGKTMRRIEINRNMVATIPMKLLAKSELRGLRA
ncbi:MAG: hypothetical protein HQM09_07100 [Candidatus Riflebacteria bacterium]|nr:hypothetical protein [Candidatus Riflebacteria bacterium]